MPVVLDDLPPWFLRIFAVAFGLIWGSFLNVVIYRVPREMSVVRPASHCPACGKPIRAWDNVPVLGYLLLRGKARCCGAKVSPRYPMVEAIGGVLSLAILEAVIFRLDPTTSVARAGAVYLADLALVLGLTATAFIDLEHMFVPDSVAFGGAALGVATCSFRSLSLFDSLLGAAIGFGIIWLVIAVYRLIRGKEGMGFGDAKLLMLVGAWFGWHGALVVLSVGAVQGSIIALLVLLFRGKLEEPEAVKKERQELRDELEAMTPEDRAEAEKELEEDILADEPEEGALKARIAFGPFLILGAIEYLLLGRDVLGLYITWIDSA